MNISYDYITEYLRETLPKSEGLLFEMEKFAAINSVPIIQKEVMCFLRTLLSVKRPKKILEIGTAIGYSALVFSEYLQPDGKLITVEINPDCARIARENFKKAGEDRIKLIEGDGEDVLNNVNEKFDVVFLDANKSLYSRGLPDILRILNKGGLLIADNVLYKGMTASHHLEARRKRTIVNNLRNFLSEICECDELTSCILPIGDGVSVSYVK